LLPHEVLNTDTPVQKYAFLLHKDIVDLSGRNKHHMAAKRFNELALECASGREVSSFCKIKVKGQQGPRVWACFELCYALEMHALIDKEMGAEYIKTIGSYSVGAIDLIMKLLERRQRISTHHLAFVQRIDPKEELSGVYCGVITAKGKPCRLPAKSRYGCRCYIHRNAETLEFNEYGQAVCASVMVDSTGCEDAYKLAKLLPLVNMVLDDRKQDTPRWDKVLLCHPKGNLTKKNAYKYWSKEEVNEIMDLGGFTGVYKKMMESLVKHGIMYTVKIGNGTRFGFNVTEHLLKIKEKLLKSSKVVDQCWAKFEEAKFQIEPTNNSIVGKRRVRSDSSSESDEEPVMKKVCRKKEQSAYVLELEAKLEASEGRNRDLEIKLSESNKRAKYSEDRAKLIDQKMSDKVDKLKKQLATCAQVYNEELKRLEKRFSSKTWEEYDKESERKEIETHGRVQTELMFQHMKCVHSRYLKDNPKDPYALRYSKEVFRMDEFKTYSKAEINKAYRTAVIRVHPDKVERFAQEYANDAKKEYIEHAKKVSTQLKVARDILLSHPECVVINF